MSKPFSEEDIDRSIEISEKTGISAQYVRNTLRVLSELRLVETPARGVYLITDLGKLVQSEKSQNESSIDLPYVCSLLP